MMNLSKIQNLFSTGILLSIMFVFPSNSHAQFKDLLKKAQGVISSPDDEIGSGLKQALEFGVNEAVDKLSA
ncbi:MAG: hypothetical protein WBB36_14400, partial [Chitinophagales bacterium]